MVLPVDQLPDEFAQFSVTAESGVDDADQEAQDTIDPDDSGADLRDRGFIGSYTLSYDLPVASDGAYFVSTAVAMFDDAGSARGFYDTHINDLMRYEGRSVRGGAIFREVVPFAGPGLGDESRFITSAAEIMDRKYYSTSFCSP